MSSILPVVFEPTGEMRFLIVGSLSASEKTRQTHSKFFSPGLTIFSFKHGLEKKKEKKPLGMFSEGLLDASAK